MEILNPAVQAQVLKSISSNPGLPLYEIAGRVPLAAESDFNRAVIALKRQRHVRLVAHGKYALTNVGLARLAEIQARQQANQEAIDKQRAANLKALCESKAQEPTEAKPKTSRVVPPRQMDWMQPLWDIMRSLDDNGKMQAYAIREMVSRLFPSSGSKLPEFKTVQAYLNELYKAGFVKVSKKPSKCHRECRTFRYEIAKYTGPKVPLVKRSTNEVTDQNTQEVISTLGCAPASAALFKGAN